MSDLLTVFWPKVEAPQIEEVKFCYDFCRRISKERCLENLSWCRWRDYDPQHPVASILAQGEPGFYLVVTDPQLLLNEIAVARMKKLLEAGKYDVCGPVFNETEFELQQARIRARYLNLSTYVEVSRDLAESFSGTSCPVRSLDPSCILYKAEVFHERGGIPSFSKAEGLLPNTSLAVDPGALVHRFGECYKAQREDLVELVPAGVKSVLDIGCAMGGYGRCLKKLRPDVYLCGVEINPLMAEAARPHYDEVIVSPIENVRFDREFDLINCGDVIEHLVNPWDMLARLNRLLRPGGFLVMSVPNIGHWSIVKDLLQGRFHYIPVGLLCITHLRWFTESSLKEALEGAGFGIDLMKKERIDPTPEGLRFIETICQSGYGDEDQLQTNELTVRAVRNR